MTTDPRRRKGDWAINSELLKEEIEAIWPVRVHQTAAYHDIGPKKSLWVVEARAVFTPKLKDFPATISTLVPVDRSYVTPYDRAEYMSLYQLYICLDALEVPTRD